MKATRIITAIAVCAGCATGASPPPPTPPFQQATEMVAAEGPDDSVEFDGSFDAYVEHALRHRPELRASLERWRSARHRIAAVDAMPPLSIGYGFFVQSVETRVGPQRHRVSVQQPIPWPGKANAAEKAAAARAQVDEEKFSSEMLDIRWEVADSYWRLWKVERHHFWHHQHQEIVRAIADSIRSRVEVGAATIADVGQAELLISRTVDAEREADEAHSRASFDLSRAAGLPPNDRLAIGEVTPKARVPAESEEVLVAAATEHPSIRAIRRMQEAANREAERVTTARYPDLGVGADWIETGPATDPSLADSGKDPVIASLSLKVPLWSGESYAAEDAARAEAEAYSAQEAAAKRDAEIAVLNATSAIRDSARRIQLYESTLIPQAEAVLGSVRGAYEVGNSGVAPLLLAQNALLELRLALAANRAEHERHWARLERLVGRPIATEESR